MTKRKSKSARTTVKAAVSKGSVIKSSAAPTTAATPPLIVLGFDDQQKPRAPGSSMPSQTSLPRPPS